MKKNQSITAVTLAGLMAFSMSASAQIIEQWTFASATPQVSDIQGKFMGNWDSTLADTSVPSAGLLRDATGGNSEGAFYGDNLGVSSPFEVLTLTVAIADINFTERDYWFEFLGTVGGNMRGEINGFQGKISLDVEGGGTALKNVAVDYGPVFDVAEYTGAISMQVAFTWDFKNGTLSYTVSGDGVGYTGEGSSAFSDTKTVAADLSGITNVKQMRVRGNVVAAGEYIDLDTVTIETFANAPEPSEWAGYPIEQDGVSVNTGTWLGWLDIRNDPWIYSYSLDNWLYIDASSVGEAGSWVYALK
jgi:hypothetical protein